jgi:hypothetical protein
VILLENFNEWNLSLVSSKRILEKREEQVLKSKRGETSFEKLHVSKKKRADEIYKLLGEILSKERKKGDHFPIVQNPMCGTIHTHTSFAFALPTIP